MLLLRSGMQTILALKTRDLHNFNKMHYGRLHGKAKKTPQNH